jgi:GDPmannose 4,6-dehydratase
LAFEEIGIELQFTGSGVEEVGTVAKVTNASVNLSVGQQVVHVDPRYFRPTEVELLIGDPTKANQKLGWKPKYTLEAMVKEMVASDLELFKADELLKQEGYKIKNYFE